MARQVFFSFHYKPDNWRASQIRNIGAIEGNRPCSDNDWEQVTRKGDAAIERWIDEQMKGRSCAVILAGSETAKRKWIDYEIKRAWELGKGVFGIYIHNIKNALGQTSSMGLNPFSHLSLQSGKFDSVVQCYNPSGYDSAEVYKTISNSMDRWIEEAIKIRARY